MEFGMPSHFGEVGALAAEEVFHFLAAICRAATKTVDELLVHVDLFCHDDSFLIPGQKMVPANNCSRYKKVMFKLKLWER